MYDYLLFNPKIEQSYYLLDYTVENLNEYLGIAYIKSSLDNAGYSGLLFDAVAMDMDNEIICNRIIDIKPRLLGITLTNFNLRISMKIAYKVKEKIPNIHITIGGHLATCAYDKILQDYPYIDSVVIGYGENGIVQLMNSLKNRKIINYPGVVVRNKGKIVLTELTPFCLNINNLQFPDRSVLQYRKENNYFPVARMISSRGCSYNCKYCTTVPFLQIQKTKRWIGRSAENVIEEIITLKQEFNIRIIVFCDDNFIGPGSVGFERIKSVINKLKALQLNIKFWIMCRVDSFAHDDDEILEILKEAGLIGVFLGVESGSDKQLLRYSKSTSSKRNGDIVCLFQKHGIMIELGFILFYPSISLIELKENAKFLKKIEEANIFKYFISKLDLFPGISIIKEIEEEGLLKPEFNYKNISAYNFKDDEISEIYDLLVYVYGKINFIDNYIWDIKRIYSILVINLDFYKKECINDDSNLEINPLLRYIKELLAKINNLNYNLFMKCINSTKSINIDEIIAVHLEEVEVILIKLYKLLNIIESHKNILIKFKDYDLIELFYKSKTFINFQEKYKYNE